MARVAGSSIEARVVASGGEVKDWTSLKRLEFPAVQAASTAGVVRVPRAVLWALTRPSRARAVLGYLLYLHFSARSPIPEAPESLLYRLGEYSVLLPPGSMLRSGNQTNQGLAYLATLACALDARLVFEIGTYNGVTAWTLARNVRDAVVHTLDLPAGATPAFDLDPTDVGNVIPFERRAYEGTPEAERVVQHFGDSALFDYAPFVGLCDLVYVDGSHSLAYVRNDTARAFELVKERGAVVWDDYWRRVPRVPEFLDSLERPLVRLPGSRLVAWIDSDI
jgi:hypothetical protein